MGVMAGQGDVASVTERVPEGPAQTWCAEPVSTVLDRAGDPTVREVPLPNLPESARLARRLAEAVLRQRWALSAQRTEYTVLLVSELVGNAVRHTGAHTIGIRMLRRSGRLRVEVRDPSRGLPCLLPVGELDTSGRGLFLVDTLAERWGVDLLPRGKTTWFEMLSAD
ncbi:ATP-binding protein [Streptomyces sp. 3N207]|uniref:ATP-binding protein n=1 Tax=Streptomyces sp. 3N207 TaxID=3457417 RepID=UPI003FD666A4